MAVLDTTLPPQKCVVQGQLGTLKDWCKIMSELRSDESQQGMGLGLCVINQRMPSWLRSLMFLAL